MIRRFLTLFKANLEFALAEKTSWGRNDLKLVIEQVITDTLLEMTE